MKRIVMLLAGFAALCGAQAQQTPLQKAWPDIQRLYQKAYPSFLEGGGVEYQMVFDRNGALLCGSETRRTDHAATTILTEMPPRFGFIIHTHRKGYAPQPSWGDTNTARKFGVPDYVLSLHELYVAMPDRTIHKVGDIRGNVEHVFLK
jgi:hypothetical protein